MPKKQDQKPKWRQQPGHKTVTLRIPGSLHKAFMALAAKHRRTLTAQASMAMEEAIERDAAAAASEADQTEASG